MKVLKKLMTFHKSSNTKSQFIRYCMVGGIAFIADFGALFLLKEWAELNYLLSVTIAFTVGVIVNYQLSIYWVFDQRAISNSYIEFMIFIFTGIVGVLMNLGIIFCLAEQFNVFYLHSKLVATAVILLFNFNVRKIYLFTVRTQKTSQVGL